MNKDDKFFVASMSIFGASIAGLVGLSYHVPDIETKVSRGTTRTGVPYVVTQNFEDYGNLVISMPGARIRTGTFRGVDYLQDNDISDNSGKKILRDEVYESKAFPGDEVKDGNQSVRRNWREHSVPNTALRNKIIAQANQVSIKEGLGKLFRDGSPDLTTAYNRDHNRDMRK
ncbi:MAG TPA: hypothetical protein VHA12_02800 [Candidatus Nanoarchaeia archaeon]|nr:hypothetical protein [Candidatus Nanoarchaeia archaeon]